jgi:hypothetical protein
VTKETKQRRKGWGKWLTSTMLQSWYPFRRKGWGLVKWLTSTMLQSWYPFRRKGQVHLPPCIQLAVDGFRVPAMLPPENDPLLPLPMLHPRCCARASGVKLTGETMKPLGSNSGRKCDNADGFSSTYVQRYKDTKCWDYSGVPFSSS